MFTLFTFAESLSKSSKSLVRVRIGCVNLDDLKPGECRDLTKKEINDLLKLCE